MLGRQNEKGLLQIQVQVIQVQVIQVNVEASDNDNDAKERSSEKINRCEENHLMETQKVSDLLSLKAATSPSHAIIMH